MQIAESGIVLFSGAGRGKKNNSSRVPEKILGNANPGVPINPPPDGPRTRTDA